MKNSKTKFISLTLFQKLALITFFQLLFSSSCSKYSPEVTLSDKHISAVDRSRRIFFQYDPSVDIQGPGGFGSDMDSLMGYVFDYVDCPGSQLDAICLDISNEGVSHYPSKILPEIKHPGLLKWRAEGHDYLDKLIAEGHKRDKEIWWGVRMNEVERGDLAGYSGGSVEMEHRNPVKTAHPEWLISSWWWQGHWNYAVKELREYRLSVIEELIEKYDFDGIHLDFLRATPHLPPGKQWENNGSMTAFLSDLRTMLQKKALDRGRPILLAVRVPDSVEGCHIDGYDIESWARNGLIDIILIGTRTIQVDLESFNAVIKATHVKLIPSFDGFHATDGYQWDQPIEFLRGVFGNYLHQGADGVGIFNYHAGSPEHALELGVKPGPVWQKEAISTIGSLSTIGEKERFYAIDRRGGYPYGEGYFSSNSGAQLPITLRNDQSMSKVMMKIWEPVKAGTQARLRLVLDQCMNTDNISVLCNDVALRMDTIDQEWKDPRLFCPGPQPVTMHPGAIVKDLSKQKLTQVEFIVPVDLLNPGENILFISVERGGPFPPCNFVNIEKIELHLKGNNS